MTLTIEQRVRCGAATVDELKSLGPERVAEIKTDDEHIQYRGVPTRIISTPAGYAPERKILRLVASTDDKDYYGDRISVNGGKDKDGNPAKGWQLDDYHRQGGVYLWSHNMSTTKAPIGQALKCWKGRIGDTAAPRERARPRSIAGGPQAT